MKSPIVITEHWDISIHPSVKHAESFLEVDDVREGIFTAYDSDGILLELNVSEVRKEYQFLLFKWTVVYENITIQESKPRLERSNELKEKLLYYLQHRGVPIEDIKESPLIKLIEKAAKYMPWRIP